MGKTGFYRQASHDLRTPLMSLRLNLDQLHRARGAPLDTRQVEMVRRMKTASEQLIEAVESLLAQVRRATRRPSAPARGARRRGHGRRLSAGLRRRSGPWRWRSRDRNPMPTAAREASR
jgi:signal transduction histidine kinase